MQKIVTRFSISVIFCCFFIGHVSASNFYELIDGYPTSIKSFRGGQSIQSSGRTYAQKSHIEYFGNALNQTDFLQNDEPKAKRRRHRAQHSEIRHSKKRRTCVRCPREIVAVARDGLDGILVEPPAPLACKTSLPFTSKLFKIETLFGPELLFVLPEGKHKIIGKIRNIETGLIVRSCLLRYNVVVRRCSHLPHVRSEYLKMSCTAGTIWGSKCAFQCKDHRTHLSHREPLVCNENLEWEGHVPECISDDGITSNDLTDNENNKKYCKLTELPANGQYKCDTKKELKASQNKQYYKTGSICQIQCNPTYSIPFHLYQMSTIECNNGAWNSTDIEVCYKEQPKRRHVSQYNGYQRQLHSNSHSTYRLHKPNATPNI